MDDKTKFKELTFTIRVNIFDAVMHGINHLYTELGGKTYIDWVNLSYIFHEQRFCYTIKDGKFVKSEVKKRAGRAPDGKNKDFNKDSRGIFMNGKIYTFDLSKYDWHEELYGRSGLKNPFVYDSFMSFLAAHCYIARQAMFNSKILMFRDAKLPNDCRQYFPLNGLPKYYQNIRYKEAGFGYALLEMTKIDISSTRLENSVRDKWMRLNKHASDLTSNKNVKSFLSLIRSQKKCLEVSQAILLLRYCHIHKPKRNNKFYPSGYNTESPFLVEGNPSWKNIVASYASVNSMKWHQELRFHSTFGTFYEPHELLKAITGNTFSTRNDMSKETILLKILRPEYLVPARGSANGVSEGLSVKIISDCPSLKVKRTGMLDIASLKALVNFSDDGANTIGQAIKSITDDIKNFGNTNVYFESHETGLEMKEEFVCYYSGSGKVVYEKPPKDCKKVLVKRDLTYEDIVETMETSDEPAAKLAKK